MSNLVLLTFGFFALLLESTLAAMVSAYPWWPSVTVPIVIYLGVSHDVPVVRGAALAFVLGYFADAYAGSPMGLETFVTVATFMLSRAVRLRLLLRGTLFQVLMTFAITALAGGMTFALRAIFERASSIPLEDVRPALEAIFAPALTTALAAPFLFALTQRIDSLSRRRASDAAVMG